MDDGGTRTFLTKDIKSVEYGEPAAGAKTGTAPTNEPRDAAKAVPHETHNESDTSARTETRYHPDKTAIQTKTFEIATGTEISVRNDEAIDSAKAVEGQTYAAEVTSDVRDANGAVVIPRGANAQLVIKSASSGGRIRGASDLDVACSRFQLTDSNMWSTRLTFGRKATQASVPTSALESTSEAEPRWERLSEPLPGTERERLSGQRLVPELVPSHRS